MAVFLRASVYPDGEGASSPLVGKVSDGGDVEHVMAEMAANGLQAFQYVGRDLHRLTIALAHPPNTLRHQLRGASLSGRSMAVSCSPCGYAGLSSSLSRVTACSRVMCPSTARPRSRSLNRAARSTLSTR